MDETASDTRHQEGVVDFELNGVLQVLAAGRKHGIETIGLGNSAWEAIKDETVRRTIRRRSIASPCDGCGIIYPFLHSALFSSSFWIMPTTISSDTSPPSSMIFFAARPSGVLAAT